MSKSEICLSVRLEGPLAEKFNRIHRRLGLLYRSNVVRYLIAEYPEPQGVKA